MGAAHTDRTNGQAGAERGDGPGPARSRWGRGQALDRRAFVATVLAAAAGAAGTAACSGDGRGTGAGGTAGAGRGGVAPASAAAGVPLPGRLRGEHVPDEDTIFGWIEAVVEQGVRRPGYDADVWAEQFIAEQFRRLGLDDVCLEPVPVTRWQPHDWSLEVTREGAEPVQLDCFPLPYSTPVDGLELDLAAFDPARPAAVAGRAALYDARIVRVPPTAFVGAGNAPADITGRVYDPDGSFQGDEHVLPHTPARNRVADAVVTAGAAAFVGTLVDYPGDSCRYFVPYHGEPVPLPGVWIRGSDGAWLHEQLAAGPVRIRLTVDATAEPFESHNVVGELPGADDDVVMIGSHHDGPWSSAVEDGSGIGLVLAQAAFWAAQPRERRPHRMLFVLQAGHMCGGAGLEAYIEAHRPELPDVVLEVHLEHAARELAVGRESDGGLVPTGRCVPRWFFTSRIPRLEAAVSEALATEDLRRSMLLAPDALGERPPTDGARYHDLGVPLVHFLAAPFYLFDEMDRLDKVDRDNLVPLTRATIRIVESTRGISAAAMRAARVV